jgi:hypothetical protein
MRGESNWTQTEDTSVGSVEALLGQVGRWSDAAANADLWVPEELTFQGQPVAQEVALAIVLDRILSRGLFPNGFTSGAGGRLYHYKRE